MTSLLPVEVAVENSLNIYIWFLHVPKSPCICFEGQGGLIWGRGVVLQKVHAFGLERVYAYTFSTYRKLFCRLG